jgi:hypothetical protein
MLSSITAGARVRSNALPIGIAASEHTAKSYWVSNKAGPR